MIRKYHAAPSAALENTKPRTFPLLAVSLGQLPKRRSPRRRLPKVPIAVHDVVPDRIHAVVIFLLGFFLADVAVLVAAPLVDLEFLLCAGGLEALFQFLIYAHK